MTLFLYQTAQKNLFCMTVNSHCPSRAVSEKNVCFDVILYVTMFCNSGNVGNCALFSYRARYDSISLSSCTKELISLFCMQLFPIVQAVHYQRTVCPLTSFFM